MIGTKQTAETSADDSAIDFDYTHDPRYRHALAKLHDLKAALTKVEEHDSAYQAELATNTSDLQALEVKALIEPVAPEQREALGARRRELEDERRDHLAKAQYLPAAIEEVKRRLDAIASEIQMELRSKLADAYRREAEAAAPLFRAAAAANARIRRLVAQSEGWYQPPIFSLPNLMLCDSDRGDMFLSDPNGQTEVSNWFRQARAAGYDVGCDDVWPRRQKA